ncbi:hypothetical protein D3C77_222130 [compost metagenome]
MCNRQGCANFLVASELRQARYIAQGEQLVRSRRAVHHLVLRAECRARYLFRDVYLFAGLEYGLKYVSSEDWWDLEIVDIKIDERADTPAYP